MLCHSNVIKIDPYNFELYRFKVGAFFLRHSVQVDNRIFADCLVIVDPNGETPSNTNATNTVSQKCTILKW